MKRILALALLALLLLAASGCSPSPTALTVAGRKIDASEYAFYLALSRPDGGAAGGSVPEELEAARADALARIVTQEVVRLKCKEFGLGLSDSQTAALAEEKQARIQELGGMAAYAAYLAQYGMTDRLYDKLRENALYRERLFTYVTQTIEQEQYGDENLRRYFGENYILVKYIRVSLLDDDGLPLAADLAAGQRRVANQAHAAAVSGAAFDTLISEYGDDPDMLAQPGGLVVSRLEAEGRPWLLTAFDLKSGEVGPIVTYNDGMYILKRLELSASYFEYNRAYILESARAHNFDLKLAEWEGAAAVKTKRVMGKINLENYSEYIK